jgi:hypothetical protein
MDKIESLIADLIQATNDIHLAQERQAEAIEALRDAWQDQDKPATYQEAAE